MPGASSACWATFAISNDGPAEDRLALHREVRHHRRAPEAITSRQSTRLLDQVGLVALGAPDGRADARLVGGADDDGARAVAEEEGRRRGRPGRSGRESRSTPMTRTYSALPSRRSPWPWRGRSRSRRSPRRCRRPAALSVPSSCAISVATAGVCLKCETVETITPPICSGVIPASAIALPEASTDIAARSPRAVAQWRGRCRSAADPLVGGVDRLEDHLVRHDPDGAVAADAEDARVRGALGGLDRSSSWHLRSSLSDRAGVLGLRGARAASRSSGVFSASVSTPGRARLARPVSVPPGQTSIRAVTPRSRRSPCTGPSGPGWRPGRRAGARTSAPSWTTCAVLVGDVPASPGRWAATSAAASRGGPTAGAMWCVWKAPATFSGDQPGLLRLVGGQRRQLLAGAGGDDLAGAVDVGRGQPELLERGERPRSGSPPSTADMPVSVTAAASAMARPRSRTSIMASRR